MEVLKRVSNALLSIIVVGKGKGKNDINIMYFLDNFQEAGRFKGYSKCCDVSVLRSTTLDEISSQLSVYLNERGMMPTSMTRARW